MSTDGYIYLIITREFLRQKSSVFKFGFTSNILKRVASYPKGSLLILSQFVHDARGIETTMLKALRENFIQRIDIGREYFEGDVNNITALINKRLISDDRINLFKSPVEETSDVMEETSDAMEETLDVNDTDVIISLFVNSHKDLIGTKLTKSTDVYEAYILWKSKNKEIKRTLTHKKITTGLKELFGAVTKVHHFDDGPAQAVFIPEQKLTVQPEVAIATFFETHCRQLSGPVKTLDLFKAFSESEYAVVVPMLAFVNVIKRLFGITVKMHDFPEGSRQAILFTSTNTVSKLNHEHHFVKEMVLSSPPESVINIQLIDLFEKFKDWLDVNVSSTSLKDRHNTTTIKFGQKMTKLVATTTNTGFEGVLKKRTKDGVRYIIDADIVRREMVSKHWISEEDACMD